MSSPVKHVLMVVEEPEHLVDFSRSLTLLCPDWELTFVTNPEQAFQKLARSPCDVIVSDMRLTEDGGGAAALLNEIGKTHPHILRFIMSNTMDKEMVMKCVLGSHHFLPKPCDPQMLRDAVMRVLTLDNWLGSEELRSLIVRIRTFPSIPSLYFEVLKELRSADASAQRVGEIIAKDLAMSTKVLQVLNSAYYAIPRQITDPTEAVNILGFEMVKSLVLCIQVFSQFDKVKPNYFSIDKLWRHSTLVAQAARRIAQAENMDRETAEEAYTAGLLHDVGKLILVSNFGDQYQQAQDLARREKLPLWEAERKVFGATHGEIGAYLIGLWGMPLNLAEAAAFHHSPWKSDNQDLCPLTLVHVANCLVYEQRPDSDGFSAPVLDDDYLNRLGLKEKINVWRDVVLGKPAGGKTGPASKTVTKPTPASPITHPPVSKPAEPAAIPNWVIPTFLIAGVVALLVVLIKILR
jgi:HD-like signal output (HDOD) protein/ActR/RegA family two-component response regulator